MVTNDVQNEGVEAVLIEVGLTKLLARATNPDVSAIHGTAHTSYSRSIKE
jgi:hypothetical protein